MCQSYDYRAIYIWNRRTTLTEEGCTEKCSFYLDENPISIMKLWKWKMWWSRWLLWCHSGLEWWWTSTLPLKSESDGLISFQAEWVAMHLQVKDYAKGKFSKSWRGNLVETILAGKWYLFPSRSLDVSHFVMEIIRYPGQCNQTVVWPGSTFPGNSFNFFQFIGSISAFYNNLVHSLMIIWWSS